MGGYKPVNRSARVIAAGLAALLTVTGVAGCSDDGDSAAPVTTQATGSTTTTTGPASTTIEGPVDAGCTTAETGPLRVMVSNDDGVINPAIDVLLASFARQTEIDLDVTVVAPAEELPGGSDGSDPGGAQGHRDARGWQRLRLHLRSGGPRSGQRRRCGDGRLPVPHPDPRRVLIPAGR